MKDTFATQTNIAQYKFLRERLTPAFSINSNKLVNPADPSNTSRWYYADDAVCKGKRVLCIWIAKHGSLVQVIASTPTNDYFLVDRAAKKAEFQRVGLEERRGKFSEPEGRHRYLSMTRFAVDLQAVVVVGQRSQKSSEHRCCGHHPKASIGGAHHAISKPKRHRVLGELHRQHRDETHATCRSHGSLPSKLVFAVM